LEHRVGRLASPCAPVHLTEGLFSL
jgi:hypothetical protein